MRTVLYLAPIVLSVLAVAVLRFGWPRARQYRSQAQFRMGLVLIAAGLVGLWLAPAGVYVMGDRLASEFEGPLYVLAVFAAAGLAVGGADAVRRADNTPSQDFWDSL